MKIRIFESHKAIKDLRKAPKQVLRAYEIWSRLVEEHGTSILRAFKGYYDEKLVGELSDF